MNHQTTHKLTCIPTSLQSHLLIPAARKAIEVNGRNAPHPRAAAAVAALASPDSAMQGMPTPLRIAVITQKYWHTDGVNLAVYFLDNPPFTLRDKILGHMNAWSQTCNVKFSETRDPSAGQVRIARGGGTTGGFWSYVGTDILQITDHSQQTMNLEGFTMNTEESEFFRVVRHETGHTLGCPHEHMRREEVDLIDERKAIAYFRATQGWNEQMTRQQVLTPLDQASIMGTPTADSVSIMCYQIPGAITKTGQPILGGTDIDATDFAFMATIYPKPAPTRAEMAQSPPPDTAAPPVAARAATTPLSATAPADGTVTVQMPNGVKLTFATGAASSLIDRVFGDMERPAHRPDALDHATASPAEPAATAHDGLDHEPDPHPAPSGPAADLRSAPAVAAPPGAGAVPPAVPAPVPAPVPRPRIGLGTRRQCGILGDDMDPTFDAHLILACAVVGHTISRLSQKKFVRFDIEAPADLASMPTSTDAQKAAKDATSKKQADDRTKRDEVVARINKALPPNFGAAAGIMAYGGYSPEWGPDGTARVMGGTGDANPNDPSRYHADMPKDEGLSLFKAITQTKFVTLPSGEKVPAKDPVLGYQGNGAYTGFVQGRDDGQSNAFCTYRHVMPKDQMRWLPSKPVAKAFVIPTELPSADQGAKPHWAMLLPYRNNLAYWGMILPYNEEIVTLSDVEGMYLQDLDMTRPFYCEPNPENIYGYTHGMIQAIYDVVQRKSQPGVKNPGTPYEIAVGQKTCKLASCFCCALFMEATGFPASSTHLGKASSWAPLYPESPIPRSSPDLNSPQNKARLECNDEWARYCRTILETGVANVKDRLEEKVDGSYKALIDYMKDLSQAIASAPTPTLKRQYASGYANLILDAVTIPGSVTDHVIAALKA